MHWDYRITLQIGNRRIVRRAAKALVYVLGNTAPEPRPGYWIEENGLIMPADWKAIQRVELV